MRSALYRVLEQAGLPTAWRTLQPHAVTILTYHGFTDASSVEGVVDHQRMRLHVDAFRRHLEHLVAHYRVLPLASLLACYREGRRPPKRGVVITFDDGYRSCYTLAYPVLKEFGAAATLFVATDFVFERKPLWHDRVEYAVHATRESTVPFDVDGRLQPFPCATISEKLALLRAAYRSLKRIDQEDRDSAIDELERRAGVRLDLSRAHPDAYTPVAVDELRTMADEGLVEVGCHTKTHAILSRCESARLRTEIVEAKGALEATLARTCDLFCYPNGTTEDFDDRARRALIDAGFRCALTTVPGRNGVDADPMELRRVGAPRDSAEFSMAVSGLRAGLARGYRATLGPLRRLVTRAQSA